MPQPQAFRASAHVVYSLHAHLVFAPKYRHLVVTERVFATLRAAWLTVCERAEAALLESNCEGDHVHLLVAYPPKLSLAALVQRLKGYSSRRVRRVHYPEVTARLWGRHFWSASYCVMSCGGAPLETIKAYVRAQAGAVPSPAVRGTSSPDTAPLMSGASVPVPSLLESKR